MHCSRMSTWSLGKLAPLQFFPCNTHICSLNSSILALSLGKSAQRAFNVLRFACTIQTSLDTNNCLHQGVRFIPSIFYSDHQYYLLCRSVVLLPSHLIQTVGIHLRFNKIGIKSQTLQLTNDSSKKSNEI